MCPGAGWDNPVTARVYGFFSRKFGLVAVVLDEINKADTWALQKPRDVAELLAPDVGVDPDVLEEIAKRQARGVQTITADTIADQQRIADAFLTLKLLPAAIQVRDATSLK